MSTLWIVPAFVVVALVFAPGMRGSAQAPAGPSPAATEELVAEKDPGAALDNEEDLVSADGRHAAWRTGRERKWGVMLDGQRQAGEFDEVRSLAFGGGLTFSLDGRRFGYAGADIKTGFGGDKGLGRVVIVDGQPGPEYDARDVSGLEFTPDSRHVIYVVHGLQEGERKVSFAVTNRTEGRRYGAVWTRTLAVQDTGTVVYVAQSGRKFVRVTQSMR